MVRHCGHCRLWSCWRALATMRDMRLRIAVDFMHCRALKNPAKGLTFPLRT
jgi:hypothetical protein